MTAYRTVLLGESHPGYSAEHPKYVASGYLVNPESSFPPELFDIAEGNPESLNAIPHVEKSLDQQIKALYMATPIPIQAKYQQEILNGLLCLREGNFPMVGYNLAQAQAKLDTENEIEVSLLTQVAGLIMPVLPEEVLSEFFQ